MEENETSLDREEPHSVSDEPDKEPSVDAGAESSQEEQPAEEQPVDAGAESSQEEQPAEEQPVDEGAESSHEEQPVDAGAEPSQEEQPAEEPAQAPDQEKPVDASAEKLQRIIAAEKETYFTTGGNVWMLVACIVMTVSVAGSLLSTIFSFGFGFMPVILDAVIVAGLWVTYALCKKKKFSTKGIQLIRIPFIILYVLTAISFAANVLDAIISMATLGTANGIVTAFFALMLAVATFVFKTICYKSVKKILLMALNINKEQSTAGLKASKMAAIAMIIAAALTFISTVAFSSGSGMDVLQMLADLPYIGEIFRDILAVLGEAGTWLAYIGRAFNILTAIVVLLANIAIAIVLLRFANGMKKARESGD